MLKKISTANWQTSTECLFLKISFVIISEIPSIINADNKQKKAINSHPSEEFDKILKRKK